MTTLTSSPATTGAAQWLRDLVAARIQYEEEFGWPVTVEVEPRRLVLAVGDVLDAVTLPAVLGETVLAQLRIAMLGGQVIASVDGGWWTFLTTPEAASRPTVAAELHAHNVRLTRRGARVIIPVLTGGDGSPQWIEAPQARRLLPPWPAVIATTRRVVDHLPAISQQLSTLDGSREVEP